MMNRDRASDCLKLYRNGHTLASIGEKYQVSRERVRQIIKKQIAYEIGYSGRDERIHKIEIDMIFKSIVELSVDDRGAATVRKKLERAKDRGIDSQYFDSLIKFSQAVHVALPQLKKYEPELYDSILRRGQKRTGRWSRYYEICRMCGKRDYKHRSYGYCRACWPKSPEFKASVVRSYVKHRGERSELHRKYQIEYQKRPEVIDRYDQKFFGGNKKAALERDGYACRGCKMSTEVKNKIGRPKTRVWHLNGDKSDNRLENLGTYCNSCFVRLVNPDRFRSDH